MLEVAAGAVTEKGILCAIVESSTKYLRSLSASHIRSVLQEPSRTIVHREPHIDEYFAELLFRASTTGSNLIPEFRELPLFSESNDHSAEYYWPGSAVFGMGAHSERLRSLPLHLFDEHLPAGRTTESCLALVLEKRFASAPPAISDLVLEINRIDSSGGAHAQHLGNAIKTLHVNRYSMGTNDKGDTVQRALDDHWKWAIVNGLLTAVVWAIENRVEFRTSRSMLAMVNRFHADNPLREEPDLQDHLERIRQTLANEKGLAQQAVFDVGGKQLRQQLLVPYAAAAATEAWGEELAYFMVEPLIEAEVAGQINFRRVQYLINTAMQSRPPDEVHEADVSITPWIVKDCRFRGRKQEWGDRSSPAPTQSNLWILSCSSDGTAMKAKQALDNYLVKHNYGVGLVLMENRTQGTKALFRSRFLDERFFDDVVERINQAEPGYWYRVQPAAPFILNGNATHLYVPKSALSHWALDRICKSVYRHGGSNR